MLLAADYSQIELRLMAHLSGDEAMRQAFWEHQDIHDFTARKIFDIGPFADVTPNQRRMAKSVNFGLLYGMSDFGLAQRLEIDRAQARAITEAYFARFPACAATSIAVSKKAASAATCRRSSGRRRYMPDLARQELRAARGRRARGDQRAAARQRRRSHEAGDGADRPAARPSTATTSTMILQIHDELIFEVERDVLPARCGDDQARDGDTRSS